MNNNTIPAGKVPPNLNEKIKQAVPGFMPVRQPDRRNNDWRSTNITDLIKAYISFQGSLTSVTQQKVNPFFNSKYADINDILKAVLPLLAKNNLAITQGNRYCTESSSFFVSTTLLHTSGQYLRSEVKMPVGGKKDAHAVGAAITYGRRYGLASMLGVTVDADDDGNKTITR